METTNIVLNDVIFFYAKIKEPGLKYGSQTDREYSVNCLITKADMQKLKAMRVNKTIKNITNEIVAMNKRMQRLEKIFFDFRDDVKKTNMKFKNDFNRLNSK